jgi:hypothetical protein
MGQELQRQLGIFNFNKTQKYFMGNDSNRGIPYFFPISRHPELPRLIFGGIEQIRDVPP